jgi:two-component system sensor histidine kinase BarA
MEQTPGLNAVRLLDRALVWFDPVLLHTTTAPAARRRARLLAAVLTVLIATMLAVTFAELLLGEWTAATIASVVLGVAGTLMGVLIRTGNAPRVASVLLGFGCAVTFCLVAVSGGYNSAVMPAVAALGVLAGPLLGARAAVWITGLSAGVIALFTAIGVIFGPVPPLLPSAVGATQLGLASLMLVVCTAMVSVFQELLLGVSSREMADAMVRVNEANAARTGLLATLSHELRTPMQGVLGLTQMLIEDRGVPEDRRRTLATIYEQGRALVEMLDGILDLSKVEAGTMVFERVPIRPERILVGVVDLMRDRAARNGVGLELQLAPSARGWVLGDPTRIRQIVLNLTSNAIKFTPRGRVVLQARVDEDRLQVSVTDTGIGIPQSKLATIFKPFTQGDASTTRRFGGTGLGLAICQAMVRQMGGEIRVHSVVGQGSTFSFDVEAPAATPPSVGGGTAPARRLFEVGAASTAPTPGRAMEPAEDQAPGGAGEDEDDVPSGQTSWARSMGENAPAEVVSSWVGDGAVSRGAQDAQAVTTQAWGQRGAPIERSEPARASTSKDDVTDETAFHLRVLIAEDNPVNQLVIRRMVEKLGLRAIVVSNGRLALDRMLAEPIGFAVVLMDWQMPEMDGMEATRLARAAGVNVPIVAVTASARPQDREVAKSAGMNGFLAKPLMTDELIAELGRFVPIAARV